MKSIVLIGDDANAIQFMDDLKAYKTKGNHCYLINGQHLSIKFDSNITRVARGNHSTIVVVTNADNKIPDHVVGYLPSLPTDHVRYYMQDAKNPPLHFMQSFIKELRSFKPVPNQLWFSFFNRLGSAKDKKVSALKLVIGKS